MNQQRMTAWVEVFAILKSTWQHLTFTEADMAIWDRVLPDLSSEELVRAAALCARKAGPPPTPGSLLEAVRGRTVRVPIMPTDVYGRRILGGSFEGMAELEVPPGTTAPTYVVRQAGALVPHFDVPSEEPHAPALNGVPDADETQRMLQARRIDR